MVEGEPDVVSQKRALATKKLITTELVQRIVRAVKDVEVQFAEARNAQMILECAALRERRLPVTVLRPPELPPRMHLFVVQPHHTTCSTACNWLGWQLASSPPQPLPSKPNLA